MWRINFNVKGKSEFIKVIYNQKTIPSVGETVKINFVSYVVIERIYDYDNEVIYITVE